MAEGEKKKAIEVARNLLAMKLGISEIARITGLPGRSGKAAAAIRKAAQS